jgi:hypothetical protein
MQITYHAAQRFLQRVMNKVDYKKSDVHFAKEFLKKLLSDVIPRGKTSYFVLPGFENFRVVYREGSVITIIPKGERYVK